jgi:hypothetical protein
VQAQSAAQEVRAVLELFLRGGKAMSEAIDAKAWPFVPAQDVTHAAIAPLPAFEPFEKIARLSRGCVITEKIDGTNAQIFVTEDGQRLYTGSRSRWITPQQDNYGFARWAYEHADELLKLGPGRHFGEWWGAGIQRNYGLKERRFSLFNSGRWSNAENRPACVGVVPVLYAGIFTEDAVENALWTLRACGSQAAPGFMQPEGIVVYHAASRTLFKKTLEKDHEPKGLDVATEALRGAVLA